MRRVAPSPGNREILFRTLTASQLGQLGEMLTGFGALDDAEPLLQADGKNAEAARALGNITKLKKKRMRNATPLR